MSRTPHVALLIPTLGGGGAERVFLTLAGAFVERGVRTDLVVFDGGGELRDRVPSGVRLFTVGSARTVTAGPGLVAYLVRRRPDGLVSTFPRTNLLAIGARAASRSRARVVVREASVLSHSMQDAPRASARVVRHLVPRLYSRADAVVAVADAVARDLIGHHRVPASLVRVIPNPVVDSHLLERAAHPVEHPWLAQGQPPVVVAAGRLAAAKDYPTLLRAFATLRARRPVRLLIVGEGELRDELTSLCAALGVRGDVDLYGFVPNPLPFMARAAAFALSSAYEGFPSVLVEAMACGTPVVSTDCPGAPREILAGGRYGTLVAVGDHAALAAALERVLDAPPDSVVLKARAAEYSVERAAAAYLEALGVA